MVSINNNYVRSRINNNSEPASDNLTNSNSNGNITSRCKGCLAMKKTNKDNCCSDYCYSLYAKRVLSSKNSINEI